MNIVNRIKLTYKNYKFKAGDLVEIRSWEDMSKEFNSRGYCLIDINGMYFTEKMKFLCGQRFILEHDCHYEGSTVKVLDRYYITNKMIKLVTE